MIKIDKILVGTHNKGKFKELCYLLPKKIKKISPQKLKIKSPRETGKTFSENSKLKARYFCERSKITSISDDSGLSINCLKGKPGIYSARWAKKYGSFKGAMKEIINMVTNKNKKQKNKDLKAKFICSLTIQQHKGKCINVTGTVHGKLSMKILGKNGFGYDPIFIANKYKKTFSQMGKKEKMLIDHRFIAYKKLMKKINFQ
jgi:XTP/dITP diphosphohydrolase|tara:strand:+ start:58 stop:663 length:606 start_codon:yes stop_codon:yes gene_type:complete